MTMIEYKIINTYTVLKITQLNCTATCQSYILFLVIENQSRNVWLKVITIYKRNKSTTDICFEGEIHTYIHTKECLFIDDDCQICSF